MVTKEITIPHSLMRISSVNQRIVSAEHLTQYNLINSLLHFRIITVDMKYVCKLQQSPFSASQVDSTIRHTGYDSDSSIMLLWQFLPGT